MGTVVSRWRAKPSTVDVLEGIDKDIKSLEEFREKNQRLLKLWVGRLLLYSSVVYLLTCVTVYLWCFPEQWTERILMALPFFAFPMLVWLMRRLLIFLFSKRTERNNEKLGDLKFQKRKILEEVMETETYKNAKLILERFDPESKKNVDQESTPVGPQMTPRPGQELRQRNVAAQAMATPVSAPRPPLAPGSAPSGPLLHSAPGGPPERNLSAAAAQHSLMRRPVSPGTPIPGMGLALNVSVPCAMAGMHPPGPPLARPILPLERGAMDRVIEYLVGDGPQNRYALICQQCLSHNGMALKEEFEYIAFRCAYCYFLNPARKTRPQAPRLPEFSFERRERSESPTPAPPAASEDDPPSATAEQSEAGRLQEGVSTISLATAPWSKVHSFNSVHHQQKDDNQQDTPPAVLEPQSQEEEQPTGETPAAAETAGADDPKTPDSGEALSEKSDEKPEAPETEVE